MVDVLLIQPPIRDFYLTAKRTIPYGLSCMASALLEDGFSVAILDALATSRSRTLEWPREMSYLREHFGAPDRSPFALFDRYRHYGLTHDEIGRRARESAALLVGISSLFTAYSDEALCTAQAVKAHLPGCTVVVGGHHATAMPEQVLACSAVDYVIRGEGEHALPLLFRALREGKGVDQVPGIAFRRTGGELLVRQPTFADDLDRYPLPASHLLDRSYYRQGAMGRAVIVTSRGCPFRCTYCSVGALSGVPHRRRSVGSVMAEMEREVGQGAGFIDFEDENLSLDREWFLDLLGKIQHTFAGVELELRAMNGLLPHTLDGPLIEAMRAAGFRTLNLSLGSSGTKQIHRFRRPDEREAFDQALALAERCGMQAVGYIIAGAPGQSPEGSVRDLLHLAERRVLAAVSIYYPSPGSEDFEHCRTAGLLPEELSRFRSTALPVADLTSRDQAATLLRLGRILNFMKALLDHGESLPAPAPLEAVDLAGVTDRVAMGRVLLQAFLHDGIIRGVTREGEAFVHRASRDLCHAFLAGLRACGLRGTR
jgi:radical SAM superfamily enzyme YgiQ (UPF0313 family)